jgi:hypothetical protein
MKRIVDLSPYMTQEEFEAEAVFIEELEIRKNNDEAKKLQESLEKQKREEFERQALIEALSQLEFAEKVDQMTQMSQKASEVYHNLPRFKASSGPSVQDQDVLYKYPDGSTYKGQYLDGVCHGYGVIVSFLFFLNY